MSGLVGLLLVVALPCGAMAQAAPGATTPDPTTLKAARDAVASMQGDRSAVLNAMAAPMVGLMQQIGVREPDKAQVLVQEVVLPTLTAHYDELLDIQARGFATVLSKNDLQAMATFYATPAGKHLAAAQPQLAQVQLQGMQQWMQAISPNMQAKLVAAIKAHGWGPDGQMKQR